MFKILVVSDTHGSITSWKMIEQSFPSVDQILHLGDILYHGPRNPLPAGYNPAALADILKKRANISYVRGNCDADVDLLVLENNDMPKIMSLTIGRFKVLLMHGEDIHNDDEILELLEKHDANVLAYGHSHIPRLELVKSKVILNPGSTSLPKMNHPPTCALIEISESLKISIYTVDGELYKEMIL
ncbi:MAG TPA: phosphodiesterase [Pseudothermotoga sp.]|nr:phosphodiesterase [Pseudothermotoga sp.]